MARSPPFPRTAQLPATHSRAMTSCSFRESGPPPASEPVHKHKACPSTISLPAAIPMCRPPARAALVTARRGRALRKEGRNLLLQLALILRK